MKKFILIFLIASLISCFDKQNTAQSDDNHSNITSRSSFNIFIGYGLPYVITSLDGNDWTINEIAYDIKDIAYGNGIFIAVGRTQCYKCPIGSVILSSTNAIDWEVVDEIENSSVWSGIIFDGTQFVIAASPGFIYTSSTGTSNWIKTRIFNKPIHNISYINNNYIVLGDGYSVLVSTDLNNWDQKTLPQVGNYGIFHNIDYGNGQYVLVGDGGSVYTSSDLNTWFKQSTPVNAAKIFDVKFANSTFVAVASQGSIITSTDNGVTWIEAQNFQVSLNGVEHKDKWIMGGMGNKLFTTDNLTDWTEIELSQSIGINGLKYF